MIFDSISPLAVLSAAAAAFGLGALWYLPEVFGAPWMAALHKEPRDLRSPLLPMLASAVLSFVTAYGLAIVVAAFDLFVWWEGAAMGLMVGLVFVAPAMLSDHLFAGWPRVLFAIQAGYRVLALGVMGAILSAWH